MTYRDGVGKTTFHQCMYGLETRSGQGSAPAFKPTSVLTNHPALIEVLQDRCNGGHKHAHLIGKGACSQAARYSPGLCSAAVKGIQVIRNKRVELDSALEMIEKARQGVSSGVDTFTGSSFAEDTLNMCPEDVLYEV